MGKIKDLTGQKFGKLTALRRADVSKDGHYSWWCVCDCNPDREILVNGDYLRSGDTRSCGCLKDELIKDITGQKFGRLTVLCREEKSHKTGSTYKWWCICECNPNKKILIDGKSLRGGATKSCGCLIKDSAIARNTTHGMSNTRIYGIWENMKARCTKPNCTAYKRYGGRGIQVCERWLTFSNFKDDMYESYLEHVAEYGEKQTTLDRIDSNGNYCKENCRWATYSEQAKNVRCRTLTYNGETHNIREWSEILGISIQTIFDRLYHGRSVEEALFKGKLKVRKGKE